MIDISPLISVALTEMLSDNKGGKYNKKIKQNCAMLNWAQGVNDLYKLSKEYAKMNKAKKALEIAGQDLEKDIEKAVEAAIDKAIRKALN